MCYSIRGAVIEYHHACLSLSPATQRNHKQRLAAFVKWCEENDLNLETLKSSHVRDFLADIGKRPGMKTPLVRNSTVRSYSKTIKAWLNWCTTSEDFADAVSPKVAASVTSPKVEETIIETFSEKQIADLFAAASLQPYAVRDAALVAFLLDTGCRASELCDLTLSCLWLDADDSYAKLMGKGRKEREVPIGRQARTMLRRYITRYRKPINKAEQHVFLAGNTGKAITRSGLHQIIAELGRKAGIKNVRVSPHTFRHTYSCVYLLQGGNLLKLCRLLGHQSIRTTERYLSSITSRQARLGGTSVLDYLKASL